MQDEGQLYRSKDFITVNEFLKEYEGANTSTASGNINENNNNNKK